jgi:SAM-dependent methyltransferase
MKPSSNFDIPRRTPLWQMLFLSALLFLLCLGIGLLSSAVCPSDLDQNQKTDSRKEALSLEKKEITIRNLTDEAVQYTIKPAHSRGALLKRTLKPGEIDRFSGDEPMDIDYQVRGKLIMNRLDPGYSYSFRYNENRNLELFLGSHGISDAVDLAPFVATPMVVADKMLQLARVDRDDVVFDLGCGDGRIVILAAKNYGAHGVGVDVDPERIQESKANAQKEGVADLVEFRLEDVMKSDFSSATVITLYLLPESNELLRPLLEKQLKPDTYVVSHNYKIPGWEAKEIRSVSLEDEKGRKHNIFVYLR